MKQARADGEAALEERVDRDTPDLAADHSTQPPTLATLRASVASLTPSSFPPRSPPPSGGYRTARCDTPHSFALPPAPARDRATLTVVRGPNAGESFALGTDDLILGRDAGADIFVDDTAVSRQHARVGRAGDGTYWVTDLGSTNGTFLGARPVRRSALASGDRLFLGPQFSFRFSLREQDEDTLQRRIYRASMRDPLTGAMNRVTFDRVLCDEIARARTEGADAALIMLDVDHFKRVNDAHGHIAGDNVLRAMVRQIGSLTGNNDVLARFGGEEFAVLCGNTSRDDVVALAERIRTVIRMMRVEVGNGSIGVTLSMGVALLSECAPHDAGSLVARADGRLFAAKKGGRDRVRSSG